MGSESFGLEQAARDVVREVPEPERRARRCLSRPLIASVGPLLVPGRSKSARMSVARCSIVRPSLRISTSSAGTPVVILAITAWLTFACDRGVIGWTACPVLVPSRLWCVSAASVVVGSGGVLVSSSPARAVQDVLGAGGLGPDEGDDEVADLGQARRDHLAACSWSSPLSDRVTVRKAWASMERVMCRSGPAAHAILTAAGH